MIRKGLFGLGFAALAALSFTAADAQLGGLGGLGNALRNAPVPSVSGALSGPAPISTNIKDAIYGDPSKDGFTPSVRVQPLTGLARSPSGGFILKPGYYTMLAQSYCLHAGTHGPSKGDGYLWGPVKGSASEMVTTILRNSANRPDIDQHDIQLLLWAIVAKAKFENLDNKLKVVASQLLSKKQLATLNRSALSVLTGPELSRLTGGMPAPLRAIAEAESRMRGMLTVPGSSFADIERVAVLTGKAPLGEGSQSVPASRWSQMPDGYWIRFRPNGYTNTQVELWVPPGSVAVGKEYDPSVTIAVPGNTARQRLAQSARVYGGY